MTSRENNRVANGSSFLKSILTPVRVARQKYIFNKNNEQGVEIGNRKIVVFESDDWGSIRVPSPQIYEKVNQNGGNLDKDVFTKNDGLESIDDLENLFSLLKEYKDVNGKSPSITAFYALRNADFKKIIRDNYSVFSDELFLDTLEEYDGKNSMQELIRKGIKEGIFCPQLHCLEHLNVASWMKDINKGRKDTLLAVNNGMYGVGSNFEVNNPFGYMDAFHNRSSEELKSYETMLRTAITDFINVFGYTPEAFTAPCYVWDSSIEKILAEGGIKYICGANYQLIPQEDNKELFDKISHPMGTLNNAGIRYLSRNVDFEMIYENEETVDIAVRQIAAAFKKHKPAIVSVHRANFVSRITERRDERLKIFGDFIERITEKWPDIEFMNTVELGRVFENEK